MFLFFGEKVLTLPPFEMASLRASSEVFRVILYGSTWSGPLLVHWATPTITGVVSPPPVCRKEKNCKKEKIKDKRKERFHTKEQRKKRERKTGHFYYYSTVRAARKSKESGFFWREFWVT